MTLINYATDNQTLVRSMIQEIMQNFRNPDSSPRPFSDIDVLETVWEEIETHFVDENEETKKELRNYATRLINLIYETH